MTPADFTKQLNAAQSEFENVVTKLAMTIAEQENPYVPGIARCVATMNVLSSAREADWGGMAVQSSEGLTPRGDGHE